MASGEGAEGFLAAQRGFTEAASLRLGEVTSLSGKLAGRNLSIFLAGKALAAAVGPSFAHLNHSIVKTGQTSATSIRLWDCAGMGVGRPPSPENSEWSASGEGWRTSTYDGGRYLCEDRPGSLLWLDRQDAELVGCFADASRLDCAVRARPLRRVMSEYCRSLGIQEIHAGLVAREGRGLLIVGGSGQGKTTTSLDGLHGGLDFLGDDSVGIGDDEAGGMKGYCLYGSARVLPHQISRWPRFAGRWQRPEPPEDKALFLPGIHLQERAPTMTSIVAVAVPRVAGCGLRVDPTSPLDALHALLHESRDNRRFGLTAAEFSRIATLIKSVPCYRFEVDDDPGRVAGALHALIGQCET
jgi:hypothetical protein